MRTQVIHHEKVTFDLNDEEQKTFGNWRKAAINEFVHWNISYLENTTINEFVVVRLSKCTIKMSSSTKP